MKEYFKQLDALRCYAVFSVIFGHMPLLDLGSHHFLTILYGYVPGVPVFFCISGFLISTIIINNFQTLHVNNFLKSFYARRFLRIFPIYYLTLLLLFIVNIDNYRSWFLYDLFYVSNIKMGLNGSFDGTIAPHFWSLAVEEQFYLFWPFLLMAFRKKYAIHVIIALIVIGVTVTIASGFSFFFARTLTALCYLGSGALLAWLYARYRSQVVAQAKYLTGILWFFLVLVIAESLQLVSPSQLVHFFISITIIPVVVLTFSLGFESRILKAILENKLILYLGKISYGLYLYHLFAIYPALVIRQVFGLSILEVPEVMQGFKIILTILIAMLSWELFERKMNGLKRYFNYSFPKKVVVD